MAWQEEDADGNRQGLTIAEFGEPGGPGMGGCPAGPGDAGAPKPGTASVVRCEDKTSLQVSVEPGHAGPDRRADQRLQRRGHRELVDRRPAGADRPPHDGERDPRHDHRPERLRGL